PSGDLYVSEDGIGSDGLVRIRPDGSVERFAMNRVSDSEMAGVSFSPDGRTMFVELQEQGMTQSIQGPWASPSRA
ncbi:MAG: DUF839 domain-containing protein, partial [Phycisphaera sp.]|nr:DUF839 domain-containing protein [Phycisphaera sp.]